MPRYHSLGKIPPKRHTIFKDAEGHFLYEELFGTIGFDGMSTLLYHTQRPTQVKEIMASYSVAPKIAVEKNMRSISLRGFEVPPVDDYLKSRIPILVNGDCQISLAAPKKSLTGYFYKNTDADEVIFVHRGSGKLRTMLGNVDFEYGGPLNDQELDAVTLYILSWESGQPRFIYPTPTIDTRIALTPPPGIDGDPNYGAQLFAENCALCHGTSGEGRIGANLSKGWPSIRPDLRVKSVIESGVPGSVMPAWSQANGGPLSDQDINDITAYILTFSSSNTESATQETAAGPLRGWPVWIIIIGVFILIIVAVVYYSRQQSQQD